MARAAASTAVSTRTPTQREPFSRVPCRYFNSSKGYFISSSTSILIRFRCYKGKECRFSHDITSQDTLSNTSTDVTDQLSSPHSEAPSSSAAEPRTVPTHVCAICLEVPKKYGLLANCSHVFCLCLSVCHTLLTCSLYSTNGETEKESQKRHYSKGIPPAVVV